MSATNVYAYLAEFKAHATSRGSSGPVTDTADDATINTYLEEASRYIDGETHRHFYPEVTTRSFDIPDDWELTFDDDLLELTTFTNGDDVAITSTNYHLMPKNAEPKYGVKLRDSSTVSWQLDSLGSSQVVLDVLGFWGYHERYTQRGWSTGSTLSADHNATTTTIAVAAGTAYSSTGGQIIKCGTELMIVSAVSSNNITVVKRGDNGSTAATHSSGAAVYIWEPMDEVRRACLNIAYNAIYNKRFGENMNAVATITGAGVVITPRDLDEYSQRVISRLTRRF